MTEGAISLSLSLSPLPYSRTQLFSSTLSAWKNKMCKQNNYVIGQTMNEHCHKVPVRPPNDRVHLGDIKKRVATKQHDIKSSRYFIGCGVGFWRFESNVGKSSPNDTASHWIWMFKETAVITRNLVLISKSRVSNVSLLHLALVVSITFRPLYSGWRHQVLGILGRPRRLSEHFEQEILTVMFVNICHRAKCTANR
jgi:hypothetical protein